ncbi:MAG: DUF2202 domain-containing protein [Chromatiaceae bacterium]|jgi:hypothetical protein
MKRSTIVGLMLATGTCVVTAAPNQVRTLDEIEATHLTFMRSEEKLARDVYLTLAALYEGQPAADVFVNIGDGSEQTHTDAVRDMLDSYGLEDPNPDANVLPDNIGDFDGGEYGWYFAEKYSALVASGSIDLVSALYVGALIEELDMGDIINCPKVIIEYEDNIGDEGCGLNYTDEKALKNLYTHLVDGSENHLRAFVKNIEQLTGVTYQAQILSQDAVDEILGR